MIEIALMAAESAQKIFQEETSIRMPRILLDLEHWRSSFNLSKTEALRLEELADEQHLTVGLKWHDGSAFQVQEFVPSAVERQQAGLVLYCMAGETNDEDETSARSKEAVERNVDRLLEDVGGVYNHDIRTALVNLGPDAVEPLIRVILRLGDIVNGLNSGDRRRVLFHIALRALGDFGDPRAVQPLIDLLSTEKGLSVPMIWALSKTGDPRASEPLIRCLHHGRSDIRKAAAIGLYNLGDPRTVEPFIASLSSDRSHKVRVYAAKALAKIGDQRAVEPLIAALARNDPDLVALLAEALGNLGDVRAVPALMTALEKSPDDHSTILVALKKLIDLPGIADQPLEIEQVMAWAFSADHNRSDIGRRILEKQKETVLIPGLSHTDPLIRNAAAAALAELKSPPSQDLLMEAALNDPRQNIRRRAVRHLDPIEDPLKAETIGPKLLDDHGDDAIRLIENVPGDGITDLLWKTSGLSDRKVAVALLKRGADRNPEIFETIIKAMFDTDDDEIKELVCQRPQAGRAIVEYLVRNSHPIGGYLKGRLKGPFQEVQEFLKRLEQEEEVRRQEAEIREREEARLQQEEELRRQEEQLREEERVALTAKAEAIIETIREKISERLGLEMSHHGSASDSNEGHYGSVLTTGLSMRLELSQRMELRHTLKDHIEIEGGETIEDLRERFRTLNFLVHHEVAHVIQDKLKIKEPSVDFGDLKRLDPQAAEHHANEILIDKLGFDAARKIYVFGEGDLIFDEEMREAIAIRSHAALMQIVLRNLRSGAHTLGDEAIARFIAVTLEMAASETITQKTKKELETLADELHVRLIAEKDEETVKESQALVEIYRAIFKQASLPISAVRAP